MTEDNKMNANAMRADLQALQDALDVHGGDVVRWPMKLRQRHAGMIAADPDARRLVDEARALDALLAKASSRDDVKAMAIVGRAVAAASSEKAKSQPAPPAIGTGPHGRGQARNVVTLKRPGQRQRLESWAAAAALIACLGLGILMGQSGWIDPAIDVIAGLEEQPAASGGLFDEQQDLFEEDVI